MSIYILLHSYTSFILFIATGGNVNLLFFRSVLGSSNDRRITRNFFDEEQVQYEEFLFHSKKGAIKM